MNNCCYNRPFDNQSDIVIKLDSEVASFIQDPFDYTEDNSANASLLKSPLLVMPVSLKLKSIQDPFILTRYDDDIEVNPTLVHIFKERYGIELPAFELENENSIELYMQKIEILADKNGWKLTREINLGLLSFLKIGMYYDIENNRDKMLQNPVIRAITGNTEAKDAVNNIPSELNNYAYDNLHPKDCYQVVSSDSSQQEAIMLSKAGISFVMQVAYICDSDEHRLKMSEVGYQAFVCGSCMGLPLTGSVASASLSHRVE